MSEQLQVDGFGQTSYEKGNGQEYNRPFKIEAGKDNVYGILPAMKSLATSPKGWKQYHRLHWGYRVPLNNDPTKSRMICFKCIRRKNREGMITKECRACTRFDAQDALLATTIAEYEKQGYSKEQIKQAVAPLQQWVKDHAPQNKWWMNVMNSDCKFSRLGISHKSMIQFEQRIDRLIKETGVKDPISLSSMVLWNFTRTSNRVQEMTEIIEPVTEMQSVDVPGRGLVSYPQVKVVQLTEALALQALKVCDDLATIGLDLTEEQIAQIADGSEDPEEIAAIIGQPTKRVVNPAGQVTQVQVPATMPVIAPKPTLIGPPGQVQGAPAPASFSGLQAPSVAQEPLPTWAEQPAPQPVVQQTPAPVVQPTQIQIGIPVQPTVTAPTPTALPAGAVVTTPAPVVQVGPPAIVAVTPPVATPAIASAPVVQQTQQVQQTLAEVSDEAFMARLGFPPATTPQQ